MSKYPEYVYQELEFNRALGKVYLNQQDAAAACFELLTDFPDCVEASQLIYEIFCDEWLIHYMRECLQQTTEEWDDRPFKQRSRLGSSFFILSRYEEWEEIEELPMSEFGSDLDDGETPEAMAALRDGKDQLSSAYVRGDEQAAEYAWVRFIEGIRLAKNPNYIQLLVANEYAQNGFFADAVELFRDLAGKTDLRNIRRMLAEVLWWRDYGLRMPWLPPPGDGSRYNRLNRLIDPDAPTHEQDLEQEHRIHEKLGLLPDWEPVIRPELKELFDAALPAEAEPAAPSPIDWSFLDREDGSSTEIAAWVLKQIAQAEEEGKASYVEYLRKKHRLTRPIPPPNVPKLGLTDVKLPHFESDGSLWDDEDEDDDASWELGDDFNRDDE